MQINIIRIRPKCAPKKKAMLEMVIPHLRSWRDHTIKQHKKKDEQITKSNQTRSAYKHREGTHVKIHDNRGEEYHDTRENKASLYPLITSLPLPYHIISKCPMTSPTPNRYKYNATIYLAYYTHILNPSTNRWTPTNGQPKMDSTE